MPCKESQRIPLLDWSHVYVRPIARAGASMAGLNFGISSLIGAQRGIGDPNDPRLTLGPIPSESTLPGAPGGSYLIGGSRPMGDPYTAAVYRRDARIRADVLTGRGDPEAAALPLLWQSGPSVSGTAADLPAAAQNRIAIDEASGAQRAPITALLRNSRPYGSSRVDSRLAQQADYDNAPAGVTRIVNPYQGSWSADRRAYIPSDQRLFQRRQIQGLGPILSEEAETATLIDPNMQRGSTIRWTVPQSEQGPLPAGTVYRSEIYREGAPLPPDPLYQDYLRGIYAPDAPRRDEIPEGDPALLPSPGASTPERPMPYTVEVPAVDYRGNWRLPNGRLRIVTLDPAAQVMTRTVNPDATYTSDREEYTTLGQLAGELRRENTTPVLTSSRLNQLVQQGRARRIIGGEGSLVGEVDIYDLEDRGIYRRPDGSTYVAPAPAGQRGFAPEPGDVVVGVQRGVPYTRTEPIYAPTDQHGNPLMTTREVVADGSPSAPPVAVRERLYRVGNSTGYDVDAVRTGLQPYIPGSATQAPVRRVTRWDLNQAVNAGRVALGPVAGSIADSQVGPGASPLLATRLDAEGRPIPLATRLDAEGRPIRVVARRDAEGRPIVDAEGNPVNVAVLAPGVGAGGGLRGDYVTRDVRGVAVPTGPGPFLLPPRDADPELAKRVVGMRRNAEKMGDRGGQVGMPFQQLISELAAGGSPLPETTQSGMPQILAALDTVEARALAAGATPQQAAQAKREAAMQIARPASQVEGPLMSTTSLERIQQALAERAGGRRVDLFAEEPLTPLDRELTARYASAAALAEEMQGGAMESDPTEAMSRQSAYGDFGAGGFSLEGNAIQAEPDAFDVAVAREFPNAKPWEQAYLADVARRRGAELVRAGQVPDPAGVVAAQLVRPVTVTSTKRRDPLQLSLSLPGVYPYARSSAEAPAPPAASAARSPRAQQLSLPVTDVTRPAAPPVGVDLGDVPPMVRYALERSAPGSPGYEGAMRFLAQRMARR